MNVTCSSVDVSIGVAGLGRLMPMHLLVDGEDRVVGVGPTLQRAFADQTMIGARFSDLFEVRSPGGATSLSEVLDLASHRFRLALRHRPRVGLRGVGQWLTDRRLALVNLSFGIDLLSAVREFGLTDADFAATDLAMELLFMAEANASVTRELRGLNLRLEGARVAAEEEALTDPLTGLRNRRAADLFLERLCASESPFGMLNLDLDYFKNVNDTLGHPAGDFVLETVGRILGEQSRAEDCAARIGGDEFLIILPGRTDPEVLARIAARIIRRLSAPIPFEDEMCQISASVGIVRSVDFPKADAAELLAAADRALYAAKHAGRGRACLLGADDGRAGLIA